MLVLYKARNPEIGITFDLIPDQFFLTFEGMYAEVAVHVISREDLHPDALGLVLEAARAVGEKPQAREEEPVLVGQLDEFGVFEEAGLDVAFAHQATSGAAG